jgi:hypothetical protein
VLLTNNAESSLLLDIVHHIQILSYFSSLI